MVSRVLYILVFVSVAVRLNAAALRGLIVSNEMGGPPLANVEVGVVAGANTTVTDDQGRFFFDFPSKQPGEMVQLVVRKSGCVVVNDVQMRFALPKDPD